MAQAIDFGSLLNDLFQGDTPVKEEKVQERSRIRRHDTDFSKILSEVFETEKTLNVADLSTPTENSPTENSAECADIKEDNTSSLEACNLYVFMRKIVMEYFGMGHDYAFTDRAGNPIKSWFTIPEAIETAKSQGYRLTIPEAREYLNRLIDKRYIETDNYKYRRCAFWNKQMEDYLQHSCL